MVAGIATPRRHDAAKIAAKCLELYKCYHLACRHGSNFPSSCLKNMWNFRLKLLRKWSQGRDEAYKFIMLASQKKKLQVLWLDLFISSDQILRNGPIPSYGLDILKPTNSAKHHSESFVGGAFALWSHLGWDHRTQLTSGTHEGITPDFSPPSPRNVAWQGWSLDSAKAHPGRVPSPPNRTYI